MCLNSLCWESGMQMVQYLLYINKIVKIHEIQVHSILLFQSSEAYIPVIFNKL